jgi:hypothetical protein
VSQDHVFGVINENFWDMIWQMGTAMNELDNVLAVQLFLLTLS